MSNPNSFTFIPGSPDNEPTPQPQQPAQPRESIEQIGGMTRFTMRFDPPKGQDLPDMDRGEAVDADGFVRIRTTQSNVQSFTFTPSSGESTSFVNASGMPASPDQATHIKIPDGRGGHDLTTVGAGEALGLVVRGPNGNWQATGRFMRGGEVHEAHQAPQALQQDAQNARMDHVRATFEAMKNSYGETQFNAMVEEHFKNGGTAESLVAGILGEPLPGGNGNGNDDAPWRSGKPAIPMLTPEQQQAMQPRAAPVDPAANVPSMVDVRVAPLAAKESALLEGTNPSAVSALKSSMAAAIASGDENTMVLAARAFAMETGASEGKVREIIQAVGANVGAPVKALAARVGVQPQQLLSALQSFDAEALGAALSQVAVSRNGSKLVALTHRALAASRRGGRR